jgi:hypothetical protein
MFVVFNYHESNTPLKRQDSESGLDNFHRKQMLESLKVLTEQEGSEEYRQI